MHTTMFDSGIDKDMSTKNPLLLALWKKVICGDIAESLFI